MTSRTVQIRSVTESDFAAWAAMRVRLWPDEDGDELARETRTMAELDPPCVAFVAEAGDGTLIGFIEVGLRSYAEGSPAAPAAYVEGIWVEPGRRRHGVARALLAAADQWGREQGATWLGSDALLDNAASHAWHRAVGFDEIERLVVFGRPLG